MSEGIHCDSILVLANTSAVKIKNLIGSKGSYVNSWDLRTLSESPGYIQRCWTVDNVESYLRVDLESGGRFLMTPGYRVLTSNNELVPIKSLSKGSLLKSGSIIRLTPTYDQKIIKEFDRESFIDAKRIDEMFEDFKFPLVDTVKIIKITEIKSNPVPFLSVTIPRFHTFGLKVGNNLIYVHS